MLNLIGFVVVVYLGWDMGIIQWALIHTANLLAAIAYL